MTEPREAPSPDEKLARSVLIYTMLGAAAFVGAVLIFVL